MCSPKLHDIAEIVKAVTTYVARRLVERQRALAEDPVLLARAPAEEAARYHARRRWRALGWFVLGVLGGVVALIAAGVVQPVLIVSAHSAKAGA